MHGKHFSTVFIALLMISSKTGAVMVMFKRRVKSNNETPTFNLYLQNPLYLLFMHIYYIFITYASKS